MASGNDDDCVIKKKKLFILPDMWMMAYRRVPHVFFLFVSFFPQRCNTLAFNSPK